MIYFDCNRISHWIFLISLFSKAGKIDHVMGQLNGKFSLPGLLFPFFGGGDLVLLIIIAYLSFR